jgi:hypothetical protein
VFLRPDVRKSKKVFDNLQAVHCVVFWDVRSRVHTRWDAGNRETTEIDGSETCWAKLVDGEVTRLIVIDLALAFRYYKTRRDGHPVVVYLS